MLRAVTGLDEAAEELFPRALDFAQRLLRTPSPSGAEEAAARIVASEMDALGYDKVEIDPAGNVVGTMRGGAGPVLMLNAHLDVVSPGEEKRWARGGPWSGAVDGDWLYGRGAADVKGSLALLVYAGAVAKAAGALPGDLMVAAVVQEEVGGLGTRYLVNHGRRPDMVVLGEPTDGQVRIGHRGRMAVWLTFRGKAGHASMPSVAKNPNYAAAKFLTKLEKAVAKLPRHKLLGPSTIAPTLMQVDATSSNVIPGETKVFLDWRTTSEKPADAKTWLKKHVGGTFEVELPVKDYKSWAGWEEKGISTTQEGFALDPAHALVARTVDAVKATTGKRPEVGQWKFSTDGRITAAAGIPTLGYSPAEEAQCHVLDERISVPAMRTALGVYARIALSK